MAKKGMKQLDWIATWLVIVGAVNWGLVAWFSFDLVQEIASMLNMPFVATLVYSLVAVSGIYAGYRLVMK